MNIRILCSEINMPEEVTEAVEAWNEKDYQEALGQYWTRLQDKAMWDTALEEVKVILGQDHNGLNLLAFQLHIGLMTYEEYRRRNIPEKIFFDTMGCFSRFVKEHQECYGCYGFDREWWTPRELSLNEFRLGELEYELLPETDGEVVSIHIPSDAKLSTTSCHASYQEAKCFLATQAPNYGEARYECESWLLTPKLKEILPETSNILGFQKDFIIDALIPEDTSYMQWVFRNEKLTLDEVPQNTSLQRKMKEYLQNGGIIGAARGHLCREVFDK